MDSGGDSSISFGNYKGLMLSNRPFGGTAVNAQAVNTSSKPNFVCGVVSGDFATSSSIVNKEKILVKKIKKETIVMKHKKWLSDLHQLKLKNEQQKLEDQRRKELLLNKLKSQVVSKYDKDYKGNQDSKIQDHNVIHNEEKAEQCSIQLKPEELCNELPEDNDTHDKKGLLEFVNGLDFENYINDIEIQTIVDQMQKRIQELETQIKRDTTQLKETPSIPITLNISDDASQSLMSTKTSIEVSAKDVLNSDQNLQAVHSMMSISNLVKKSQYDLSMDADSKTVNEPRVTIHDTNRLDTKVNVNTLPYLHRNPSI